MSIEQSQPTATAPQTLEVVVVIDDEPPMLRALKRSLGHAFEVLAYDGAEAALARLREGGVSVVLSDIGMPGMSGLELLRAVRQYDSELPVLLMTGAPSLESATQAIEHGVFRYLPKPIDGDELSRLLAQASQLHRLARLKREARELRGAASAPGLVADDHDFRDVLENLGVVFQPIVSTRKRRAYGYEALMRSSTPGFNAPSQLLALAERSGTLDQLGRAVRERAIEGMREAPSDALLFVNLHPQDLNDPQLTAPHSPLVAMAHRVVLEITERASLEGIGDVHARVAKLRSQGFRIAVDDLGAGYAGLSSFVLLEPEIVKLDTTLIRGIDQSTVKQKLVRSIHALCHEMGVSIIVEGVETLPECDTLVALGCDLMQGHLFAHPDRSIRPLRW